MLCILIAIVLADAPGITNASPLTIDNSQEIPLDRCNINEDCYTANRKTIPSDLFKEIQPEDGKKEIVETYDNGYYSTLCWVEVILLHEIPSNNTIYATKEYSIILDAPADIPNENLETTDKSLQEFSTYEIYNRNTKKSKKMIFKKVSDQNGVTIREHKEFVCGSGPVLHKTLTVWPNTQRKRIEIKVSPKNAILENCNITKLDHTPSIPLSHQSSPEINYSQIKYPSNEILDDVDTKLPKHLLPDGSEEQTAPPMPIMSEDDYPKTNTPNILDYNEEIDEPNGEPNDVQSPFNEPIPSTENNLLNMPEEPTIHGTEGPESMEPISFEEEPKSLEPTESDAVPAEPVTISNEAVVEPEHIWTAPSEFEPSAVSSSPPPLEVVSEMPHRPKELKPIDFPTDTYSEEELLPATNIPVSQLPDVQEQINYPQQNYFSPQDHKLENVDQPTEHEVDYDSYNTPDTKEYDGNSPPFEYKPTNEYVEQIPKESTDMKLPYPYSHEQFTYPQEDDTDIQKEMTTPLGREQTIFSGPPLPSSIENRPQDELSTQGDIESSEQSIIFPTTVNQMSKEYVTPDEELQELTPFENEPQKTSHIPKDYESFPPDYEQSESYPDETFYVKPDEPTEYDYPEQYDNTPYDVPKEDIITSDYDNEVNTNDQSISSEEVQHIFNKEQPNFPMETPSSMLEDRPISDEETQNTDDYPQAAYPMQDFNDNDYPQFQSSKETTHIPSKISQGITTSDVETVGPSKPALMNPDSEEMPADYDETPSNPNDSESHPQPIGVQENEMSTKNTSPTEDYDFSKPDLHELDEEPKSPFTNEDPSSIPSFTVESVAAEDVPIESTVTVHTTSDMPSMENEPEKEAPETLPSDELILNPEDDNQPQSIDMESGPKPKIPSSVPILPTSSINSITEDSFTEITNDVTPELKTIKVQTTMDLTTPSTLGAPNSSEDAPIGLEPADTEYQVTENPSLISTITKLIPDTVKHTGDHSLSTIADVTTPTTVVFDSDVAPASKPQTVGKPFHDSPEPTVANLPVNDLIEPDETVTQSTTIDELTTSEPFAPLVKEETTTASIETQDPSGKRRNSDDDEMTTENDFANMNPVCLDTKKIKLNVKLVLEYVDDDQPNDATKLIDFEKEFDLKDLPNYVDVQDIGTDLNFMDALYKLKPLMQPDSQENVMMLANPEMFLYVTDDLRNTKEACSAKASIEIEQNVVDNGPREEYITPLPAFDMDKASQNMNRPTVGPIQNEIEIDTTTRATSEAPRKVKTIATKEIKVAAKTEATKQIKKTKIARVKTKPKTTRYTTTTTTTTTPTTPETTTPTTTTTQATTTPTAPETTTQTTTTTTTQATTAPTTTPETTTTTKPTTTQATTTKLTTTKPPPTTTTIAATSAPITADDMGGIAPQRKSNSDSSEEDITTPTEVLTAESVKEVTTTDKPIAIIQQEIRGESEAPEEVSLQGSGEYLNLGLNRNDSLKESITLSKKEQEEEQHANYKVRESVIKPVEITTNYEVHKIPKNTTKLTNIYQMFEGKSKSGDIQYELNRKSTQPTKYNVHKEIHKVTGAPIVTVGNGSKYNYTVKVKGGKTKHASFYKKTKPTIIEYPGKEIDWKQDEINVNQIGEDGLQTETKTDGISINKSSNIQPTYQSFGSEGLEQTKTFTTSFENGESNVGKLGHHISDGEGVGHTKTFTVSSDKGGISGGGGFKQSKTFITPAADGRNIMKEIDHGISGGKDFKQKKTFTVSSEDGETTEGKLYHDISDGEGVGHTKTFAISSENGGRAVGKFDPDVSDGEGVEQTKIFTASSENGGSTVENLGLGITGGKGFKQTKIFTASSENGGSTVENLDQGITGGKGFKQTRRSTASFGDGGSAIGEVDNGLSGGKGFKQTKTFTSSSGSGGSTMGKFEHGIAGGKGFKHTKTFTASYGSGGSTAGKFDQGISSDGSGKALKSMKIYKVLREEGDDSSGEVNGYKVTGGGGVKIIPGHVSQIVNGVRTKKATKMEIIHPTKHRKFGNAFSNINRSTMTYVTPYKRKVTVNNGNGYHIMESDIGANHVSIGNKIEKNAHVVKMPTEIDNLEIEHNDHIHQIRTEKQGSVPEKVRHTIVSKIEKNS